MAGAQCCPVSSQPQQSQCSLLSAGIQESKAGVMGDLSESKAPVSEIKFSPLVLGNVHLGVKITEKNQTHCAEMGDASSPAAPC